MAKAQLVKPAIDIGLVTTAPDAMVDFYGGVIGLQRLPDVPMGGFLVRRFQVGDCVLKLVTFDDTPSAVHTAGPLGASTGIRYWTVSVSNLDDILTAVRASGQQVVDGPTEVRPGVRIALVADPDGNLVEFINRPTREASS